MLAPLHDDATIDEAVAALAREPGGYLIAADEGLGSVPLEVRVARRWREMDSNYWSRQGETSLGRHVVSARGSTSVTSPRQQPASDRRYLQPATISHLAIVLRTFRSFGPGTRSTGISRC